LNIISHINLIEMIAALDCQFEGVLAHYYDKKKFSGLKLVRTDLC